MPVEFCDRPHARKDRRIVEQTAGLDAVERTLDQFCQRDKDTGISKRTMDPENGPAGRDRIHALTLGKHRSPLGTDLRERSSVLRPRIGRSSF